MNNLVFKKLENHDLQKIEGGVWELIIAYNYVVIKDAYTDLKNCYDVGYNEIANQYK